MSNYPPFTVKARDLESFQAVHMFVGKKPVHAVFLTKEVKGKNLKLTFAVNGENVTRTVPSNFYFARV